MLLGAIDENAFDGLAPIADTGPDFHEIGRLPEQLLRRLIVATETFRKLGVLVFRQKVLRGKYSRLSYNPFAVALLPP